MPVQFLTEEQCANYGCYLAEPTAIDLMSKMADSLGLALPKNFDLELS